MTRPAPAPALRSFLDLALARLARLMLRVFFRDVELVGLERVPRDRPLLVVANHVNSIADPLLLLAFLDVRPRILAKNTLFSHPVVGPLLWLVGALPVYRRQDARALVTRNFATFEACRGVLARGGCVVLFPEGMSHNEPRQRPLKTGAARLALEAERSSTELGLRILPVGLTYEDKQRFRSRVLLQVGEPIDPAPEAAAYRAGARSAVRALNARVATALEAITVNFDSWDEARLVARAVALFEGDPSGQSVQLFRQARLWRAFARAYRGLQSRDPERLAQLVLLLEEYDRRLCEQAERAQAQAPRAGKGPWLRLLAPLGLALNFVPYRLVGGLSRRLSRTPDEPATYMLLGGLLFFPGWWLLQATLVGLVTAPVVGLLALLLAPLLGAVALRAHEPDEGFAHRLRGGSAPRPADLQDLERRLQHELQELAAAQADLLGEELLAGSR